MRVAAVVQRYGTSVAGGAERLAREVCTRLALRDDVTVLTTTARDYVTWRNEFEPGEEVLDGVRIRRFPVARERSAESFRLASQALFASRPTLAAELDWVRLQGPDTPALYREMWRTLGDFEAVLFFTYLYAPTVHGLAIAPGHAVLVPLAHNEAPLYLRTFKNLLRLPRQLVYQTPEEQALVERVVPRNPVPSQVVGYGVDLPRLDAPVPWPTSVDPGTRYLLYLGRLDPSKGIPELLERFTAYRRRGSRLELVLAGEAAMELPEIEGVRRTGFVSEEERDRLLAHARIVVQPSLFESLSIVALEAWARARPVLAQRGSDVLAAQINRSHGGFLYGSGEEFDRVLELAEGDAPELAEHGRSGQDFVRATCSWEQVTAGYRRALEEAASPPVPRSESPTAPDARGN